MNCVSFAPLQQDLVVKTVSEFAPRSVSQTASKSASKPAPRLTPRDRAADLVESESLTLALSSKGKRFPRTSRLLRHADFDRVYREGKRHFSTNMTVFFLPRTDPPACDLRIGLTVSRALGGAVDRNRLKRRMREAVRMTRPTDTPAIDVVINPKRTVLKTDFEVLAKEVDRALQTVLRKTDTAETSENSSGGGR